MMVISQIKNWFWIIFACDICLLALQISHLFGYFKELYMGDPQLTPNVPLETLPPPPPPPEKKEPLTVPVPPAPSPEQDDSDELDIDHLTDDEDEEPVPEPKVHVPEPVPVPVPVPEPVPIPVQEPTAPESQRLTQENLERYNTNKSKLQVDPSVKSQDLNL
jgi:hypothetical protein